MSKAPYVVCAMSPKEDGFQLHRLLPELSVSRNVDLNLSGGGGGELGKQLSKTAFGDRARDSCLNTLNIINESENCMNRHLFP